MKCVLFTEWIEACMAKPCSWGRSRILSTHPGCVCIRCAQDAGTASFVRKLFSADIHDGCRRFHIHAMRRPMEKRERRRLNARHMRRERRDGQSRQREHELRSGRALRG